MHNPYGIGANVPIAGYSGQAHTSAANQHDVAALAEVIREAGAYGSRQPPFVEHIYESPTFSRKDYSRESSETSAKYFELEQDTDPLSLMQREKNVTCHYPRILKPALPSRIIMSQPATDTNTHTNSHSSY